MSDPRADKQKIQTEAVPRKTAGASDLVDVLVFLIPCVWFIQFRIVGVLSGSDILCILTFLYFSFRLRFRIESSVGRWIIILGLLWLAAQIVTDVIRRSAFSDYARGWSNIGMTIAYISVLWTLLYGRPHRIVIFGWGLCVGGLLTYFINPDEYMIIDPWKFGLAIPASLFVLLVASRRECRGWLPAILSLMIGAVNFVMGARSVGGTCVAVSLYLIITRVMQSSFKGGAKLRPRTQVAIAASVVLGIAGVIWAYEFAAGSGILGESAREKYELEASGKYGILLGGREEMLGSIPAIYDSPILGHGSFARDPTYLLAAQQALALMDYKDAENLSRGALEEGYIPTHSYLLGAWVSAGILGAVFWAWVWILVLRSMMRVYPDSVALLPIASFAAFLLLWCVWFTPLGAEERMTSAYYIVMLMTCMQMATAPAEQRISVKEKRPAKPLAGVEHLRGSEQT